MFLYIFLIFWILEEIRQKKVQSFRNNPYPLIILIIWIKLQEGSIGQDVVIKPVPHGLINDESSNGRAHHIVYKRKVDKTDQFSDFGKIIYKIIMYSILIYRVRCRLYKSNRKRHSFSLFTINFTNTCTS